MRPFSAGQRSWSVAPAIVLATIYCIAFLVRPGRSWPEPIRQAIGYSSELIYGVIDAVFPSVGTGSARTEFRSGMYLLVVAGMIPWLVSALLGRGRPYDFGVRRPNACGWRFILIGYVIALPFLAWMVRGAGFPGPYVNQFRRTGAFAFTFYYFVNMLTEHFFLHGVLLAAFRPGHRWPEPPPVITGATNGLARFFQRLGLAQPTRGARGIRRFTRWMGLPDHCMIAVLASAMLFGLVHVGKDPRELLLSVPGGAALAYMAYRTNTWLIPFILHLATAGTACGMILVMG